MCDVDSDPTTIEALRGGDGGPASAERVEDNVILVGVEVAFVGVAAMEDGAFDLDATEASAIVDDEVVGGGVSPRLGDAESELDGASRKAEFGPFAALFGVTDGKAGRFHLHF